MVSGFFQIPYLLLLYLFLNLSIITTMDLLYFPPILDFSLKNFDIWNSIFIILTSFLVIQCLVGAILIIWGNRIMKKALPIAALVSLFQLFYFPIGTYYGLYEIQLVKRLVKIQQQEQNEMIQRKDSEPTQAIDSTLAATEAINKKIGQILIGIGSHWVGLLLFLILLTFYFTTVMLDMTYPYLTMSVLLTARTIFWVMMGLSIIELIFGIFYKRIPDSKIKRIIYGFFWIWSLILIPVGTSGAKLMRKLHIQTWRE